MRTPRITGELRYVLKPWAVRRRWAIFYIVAIIVVLFGISFAAEKYRTYSVPTGSVELQVPYVTYLVGEPISFTITNNFDSTIYIPNECPNEPLRVYKLQDGIWKNISASTSPENCQVKDRQIKVGAHGSQNGTYEAWPELFAQPGKYRIVAYVDYYNVAPYQDFEVIAKPQKQKVYVSAPAPKSASPQASTTKKSTQTATSSSTATLQPYTVSTKSGTIYVEYSTSTIYVRKITPASGCDYEGGRSGPSVEVQFNCNNEITVKLWLSNGKIQQRIET